MRNIQVGALAMLLGVAGVAACGGAAPSTQTERTTLEQSAQTTLNNMRAKDPSLDGLLGTAVGYVVFPNIGKGGFVVGGAHGRGVLFEGGRATGYVEVSQASIGAQVGAQSFAEIVIFHDPYALQKLKAGTWAFGADASAVALSAGAAAGAQFKNGVAVLTMPHGGLMAELSLNGQKLNYQPRG